MMNWLHWSKSLINTFKNKLTQENCNNNEQLARAT